MLDVLARVTTATTSTACCPHDEEAALRIALVSFQDCCVPAWSSQASDNPFANPFEDDEPAFPTAPPPKQQQGPRDPFEEKLTRKAAPAAGSGAAAGRRPQQVWLCVCVCGPACLLDCSACLAGLSSAWVLLGNDLASGNFCKAVLVYCYGRTAQTVSDPVLTCCHSFLHTHRTLRRMTVRRRQHCWLQPPPSVTLLQQLEQRSPAANRWDTLLCTAPQIVVVGPE
jgi:hypothetical protein